MPGWCGEERWHLRLTSPCHLSLPLISWAQTPSEPFAMGKAFRSPIPLTLLIVMCWNLFKLLFRQSVPLEPFPVLDTTNYLGKGSG